jgi:hypothetical protein
MNVRMLAAVPSHAESAPIRNLIVTA